MPAVGSSKISTDASTASQRPIITFCWLPPDSVLTSVSIVGALTLAAGASLAAARRTEPGRHQQAAPGRLPAEHDVVGDRLVEQQALALAVGREEGDARRDRGAARP